MNNHEWDDIEEHPYVRNLNSFRKVYNAALFNEWAKLGLYEVHKSKSHNDGSLCFGGDMFIVVAVLPTGLISNHYFMEDWKLFHIPEFDKALFPYDGHQPSDVIRRLTAFIKQVK